MLNDVASTNSCWMSLFELQLHLFTRCWRCKWPECVCMPLYVLWILQQAHLVAMCQCHRPLCFPSGCFTHSASRDSCSIRRPSRTTDTQTKHEALTHLQYEYWRTETQKRMGKWVSQARFGLRLDQKRILQVQKIQYVGKKRWPASNSHFSSIIYQRSRWRGLQCRQVPVNVK